MGVMISPNGKKKQHPKVIEDARMRPGIVFHSSDTRQIAMVELTERQRSKIEEANTYNIETENGLSKELVKSWIQTPDIAGRALRWGFVGISTYNFLRKLSIKSQVKAKAFRALVEPAENSSKCIWG
ncbi:reverse transcriptase [Plakobranchus ocellatus]|uniref:Reverse transcriptase n=1 Tax=Plakobranchus ocellatus TaxID=259542 RepID=A0AAV3ZD08_9GAST|nr:reverse transcriptase [Plakobranchus ocellatus]